MSSGRLEFYARSYVLLGGRMGRLAKDLEDLAPALSRAGLLITQRAYVAGMLVGSTAAAVGAGLGGLIVALLFRFVPAFLVAVPLAFALLGWALTFSVFYLYPSLVASSRGRKLDSQLPHTIGHMAVLASAGLTPEMMFHSLAEEEDQGVVSQEARMVVRDMSLLGMDLEQALEAERKRSPSEDFAEFLDGFVSASKTGGEVKTYLLRSASSLMLDKRLRARSIGESVGFVAELYTILLVVTPLLLLIMFSVIGIVVGSFGGLSILTLINLVTYAVVPLGGLAVLVVADSTVSREVS